LLLLTTDIVLHILVACPEGVEVERVSLWLWWLLLLLLRLRLWLRWHIEVEGCAGLRLRLLLLWLELLIGLLLSVETAKEVLLGWLLLLHGS